MRKIKVDIDAERCKGCGYCIHVCSQKILKRSSSMNSKGYYFPVIEDAERCTGCTSCALVCPETIIEIEAVD